MYSWIWQRLPGNFLPKVLSALALAGTVIVALFGLVFPWIDGLMGGNSVVN